MRDPYRKYLEEYMLAEYWKTVDGLTIDQSKYNVELLDEQKVELEHVVSNQNNTLEYKYEHLENRNKQLKEQMKDMMMCRMKEFMASNRK